MTDAADLPFIPIRPTAVAATEDMGILVWVLGPERAIPNNYKHLELNEARINWFNASSNYNDVVSSAADEAGGQGFVTEMAAPSSATNGTLVQPWERQRWMDASSASFSDAYELLSVAAAFAQWDGFGDALRAAVTLPNGVSVADFVGCPECFREEVGEAFDLDVLRIGLWEKAIRPMFDTQDLVSRQRHITRFYTTMSADEMTVDPSFDFNADLPPLSNVHTASRIFDVCGASEWRVPLPLGGFVWGRGNSWPTDPEQPAALKILQLGKTGRGETLQDNTELVLERLVATELHPMPPPSDLSVRPNVNLVNKPMGNAPPNVPPSAGTSGNGADTGLDADQDSRNACGCSAPGARSTHPAYAALFAALVAVRLRRRGR